MASGFFLIFGVGLVIGALLIAIGLRLLMRASVPAAHQRLARLAAGRAVRHQSEARSLGVRIDGARQIRGAGQLALVEDELIFAQYWGRSDYGWRRRGAWFRYRPDIDRRDLRVRRDAIVSVTRVDRFLGKAGGRLPLLCVEWRTPGGGLDASAWQVADLDGWVAALGRRASA